MSDNDSLYKLGYRNLILSGGLILGHLLAIATMDRVGRLPLQIIGFGLLTVLLSILGWTFPIDSVDVVALPLQYGIQLGPKHNDFYLVRGTLPYSI